MHRWSAAALGVIYVAVQFCCAPPLRAAARESAAPMQCPIQKEECDLAEQQECSGRPELVSDYPVTQATSMSGAASLLAAFVPVESAGKSAGAPPSARPRAVSVQLRI